MFCSGVSGFFAGDAETLTSFPKALTADAQFVGQLRLGHPLLVFQYKMLEIVFQRQVFGWLATDALFLAHGFQRVGRLGCALMFYVQFDA